MIFVTVGSQKFQFNRLLKKIDELIEKDIIKENVFAQIGVSEYIPKNYKYKRFITQKEFNEYISKSDMVITHAGTGVIINSIKMGKKVIGIPRQKKYGEHVDNHQIQLIEAFQEMGYIEGCYNLEDLKFKVISCKEKKFNKYQSNTDLILDDIEKYIEGENNE